MNQLLWSRYGDDFIGQIWVTDLIFRYRWYNIETTGTERMDKGSFPKKTCDWCQNRNEYWGGNGQTNKPTHLFGIAFLIPPMVGIQGAKLKKLRRRKQGKPEKLWDLESHFGLSSGDMGQYASVLTSLLLYQTQTWDSGNHFKKIIQRPDNYRGTQTPTKEGQKIDEASSSVPPGPLGASQMKFKPLARSGNWLQCKYWSKIGHSLLSFLYLNCWFFQTKYLRFSNKDSCSIWTSSQKPGKSYSLSLRAM